MPAKIEGTLQTVRRHPAVVQAVRTGPSRTYILWVELLIIFRAGFAKTGSGKGSSLMVRDSQKFLTLELVPLGHSKFFHNGNGQKPVA
jgi:hypothetical protein